jgi:hypothetical protein
MAARPFQYSIRRLLGVVAGIALVLGAASGAPARWLLMGLCVALVFLAAILLLCFAPLLGYAAALGLARGVARVPFRVRRSLFERRLGRLRPGNSFHRVCSLLGAPGRIDGFGDRIYWSYRVAGRRYTVSLDPRRLVATYCNGLAHPLRRAS